MKEKLVEDLNLQDTDDCFYFPHCYRSSTEDEQLIREMEEILAHDRFRHEGWVDYQGYRLDACRFILKLIRGDYDEAKQ